MQMWEIVSVFFNHIDAAFKNWGLFKTHLILLGLFICWCSGNNQKKSQLKNWLVYTTNFTRHRAITYRTDMNIVFSMKNMDH